MLRRAALVYAAVLFAAFAAPALGQSHDPERVRVALLPDQDPLTVIWANKPLAAYLEERLGRPVDLVVPEDYDGIIEAMLEGEVELAYFGPVSYTIAADRAAGGAFEIVPFAARMRDGGTTYRSVVIAGTNSGIADIAEIEGSGIDLAYGDPSSTSSHMAPRYMLLEAGVTEGDDYSAVFLGKHDLVAEAVANGQVPVGALSRVIYERLLREGTLSESDVRVIATTEALPQYPWTMRSDLTPELREAIRSAFLGLQKGSPWMDAVLLPFGADGFAPIEDGDYRVIRAIRDRVG